MLFRHTPFTAGTLHSHKGEVSPSCFRRSKRKIKTEFYTLRICEYRGYSDLILPSTEYETVYSHSICVEVLLSTKQSRERKRIRLRIYFSFSFQSIAYPFYRRYNAFVCIFLPFLLSWASLCKDIYI